MDAFVTWFEPTPSPLERPTVMPSPFDEAEPQLLARRAAEALQTSLRAGRISSTHGTSLLLGPEGGKMFGVLVVADPTGRVGFLRAFSGVLDKAWEVEGFVPPVFDRAAREAVEGPGEAAVTALSARVEALRSSPALVALRARWRALQDEQETERVGLRARHEQQRNLRRAERARLKATPELAPTVLEGAGPQSRGPSTGSGRTENRSGRAKSSPHCVEPRPVLAEALHALDQQSRADSAELRRADASWAAARASVEQALAPLERRLAAQERLRRVVSQEVMRRIHDTYQLSNWREQHTSLRALFAPKVPPSGAADCAAPKLLAFALARRLTPLALAEFWWGAPPPGGGRLEGAWFPACGDKCGPLLPFLLEGLAIAPSRRFTPHSVSHLELAVVSEDARLVVVNKPAGLLSVPGRDDAVTDSVLARVRAKFPHATGPMLVHRLDLDTSGLLLVALDVAGYAALQRQFISREVRKRYVAWVDGIVPSDRGTIDLPLRVDLEHRPRQLHDPVHGRPAVTDWEVLERRGGRTRLALFPRTGRTHQLRVHAAHPLGLGLPVVGDRLYGRPAQRLMLHAEALTFVHPHTGKLVTVEAPAPF